eukprot:12911101-Prorocentrum_lima.AAC.1
MAVQQSLQPKKAYTAIYDLLTRGARAGQKHLEEEGQGKGEGTASQQAPPSPRQRMDREDKGNRRKAQRTKATRRQLE